MALTELLKRWRHAESPVLSDQAPECDAMTPTAERRRKTTLRRLYAMLTGEAQTRLRTEEEAEGSQAEVQESVAA